MKRKFLYALLALIVLAALLVAGGVWYIKRSRPDYDATVHASVREQIEVWRDSAGVPHVWAANTADMLFAQGYVHAQERLWQMELFRRVGEGRLAEIFGESMVETDKFLRTLGIWHAAAANLQQLPAEQRQLLDAYVAGVNHWINTQDGPLPPEFVALRIGVQPWTLQHSLAIEKIMAWDLTIYEGAAQLTNAVRRVGLERAKYLFPSDPSWGTTIIEAPEVPAIPPNAAALLDALSITRASNAWVIGGSRTRSGKPILANDMHLMLRQPGVWYLMALHAPGIDVAGMTIPGVPHVIAGHSKAVAWGFTNVMMDDIDLFIERLDPADSTRYLTPGGAQPFGLREERLRIKGRDSALVFTVRTTRHGPVMSDVDQRLRGQTIGNDAPIVSVQWAALDTSRSFRAFHALNQARNADEVRTALRDFNNPHQNVVYADTAGNFGYQMAGRVPVRGNRLRPPSIPVPGWSGEHDWRGYLPFEEHPAAHNPAQGYAVTANNRQARGAVGDLISNDWDMPYRAARIRDMVRAHNPHDAASVHRMQLDVTDLLALKYKRYAASAARLAGRTEVAQLLERWDAQATRDSRAAPYFYVWYEHLRRQISRTLYGSVGFFPRDALNEALDSGRVLWSGAEGKQQLDSLAAASMLHSDSVVRGQAWGDVHYVVAAHVMGEVATVERFLDLNVGPRPHQGSPTTVNVAQYSADEVPIRTSYGASQRHVVDMANIDGAGGFILPTGQSGLPASPHYKDMFERWRNGGLWPIPLEPHAAEARAVHRMTISPKRN
ncbi:MAG TPA: penicillin acylase family protein [Longimicrobiales bacterium]